MMYWDWFEILAASESALKPLIQDLDLKCPKDYFQVPLNPHEEERLFKDPLERVQASDCLVFQVQTFLEDLKRPED